MAELVNSVFIKIYYWVLLSGLFYIGCVLGIGIFGLLPSLITVLSIHRYAKGNYQLIRFKHFLNEFKVNLRENWLWSSLYFISILLVLWGIWFTSQFKGIIFLISLSIQAAFCLILIHSLGAHAQLKQVIEASSFDFFKLSLIHFFITPRITVLNLIFNLASLMLIFIMPAVAFLFLMPIWLNIFTPIYNKAFIERGWVNESESFISE